MARTRRFEQQPVAVSVTVVRDKIMVMGPYNAQFVDDLKRSIPPEQRTWNSNVKAWYLTPTREVFDSAVSLIRQHYGVEPLVVTPSGSVEAVLDTAVDTTSYYTILGLSHSATPAEIKSAYRKKIVLVHPDRGGKDYLFRIVQQAYDTLSDEKKRKRYDAAFALVTNKDARVQRQTSSW